MGLSEVLLCPYRYLEHIMVNSNNSKFNSAIGQGDIGVDAVVACCSAAKVLEQ